MKKTIYMQGLEIDDFTMLLEKILDQKLREILEERLTPPKEIRYLTRKELAELLHISLATVHAWVKEGKIKSYRIGTRILFRNDEINTALSIRKFTR